MEVINVDNINRNDLRIIVHGAFNMIYADEEVSYHEQAIVNKIYKAANLNNAEKVRLKNDIRNISSKALVRQLSSIDSRRLYLLMVKVVFYSDDDIAEQEIAECERYAKMLNLSDTEADLLGEKTKLDISANVENFFSIMVQLRKKFVKISPLREQYD